MTPRIPDTRQCLDYHDRFAMLDNIRAHSLLVARVARSLGCELQKSCKTKEQQLDLGLVNAAALLHDIAKTPCLKTGCSHADYGQEICNELGHPEVGEIVAEHVRLKNFAEDLYRQGIIAAKELVYYSDKRVNHDQIVSLSQRLDYILQRYGDNNPQKMEAIRKNFDKTLRLEEHLFKRLPCTPDELPSLVAETSLPA